MNGWLVFLLVLLVLWLLGWIRVGARVTYSAEGLGVSLRLGKFWLRLLPAKPKPEGKGTKEASPKQKKAGKKTPAKGGEKPAGAETASAGESPSGKEQKEQEEQPQEKKKPKGGLPVGLMDLISIATDAVGQLLSRLQIDLLHIEYDIGGKQDPASAAIQYGMLCAGGGAIVPLLENTFYRVKKREIGATIDFEKEESLVYLALGLSIRIGQIFALAGHLLWAFLKAFWKKRKLDRQKAGRKTTQTQETKQETEKQEGKNNGTEASRK